MQQELTMIIVYRVSIDEAGRDDCRDYTSRKDARQAFLAAKRREGVLSVRLDKLGFDCEHAPIGVTLDTALWEYPGKVGLQHR